MDQFLSTFPTDFYDEELSSLSTEELEYIASVCSPIQQTNLEDDLSILLSVTFNNILYTHIDSSDSFERSVPQSVPQLLDSGFQPSSTFVDDKGGEVGEVGDGGSRVIKLTALDVMKESFPETKSLYRRCTPPPEFFLFGASTRRKILRCAQLGLNPPPVTDRTREYVQFFKYLSRSPHIGGYYAITQYYSASLFAANYDHELATSLMLYYGWPPDFRRTPMSGTSIHTISHDNESVTIHIKQTHTVQERLDAAYAAIIMAKDTSPTSIAGEELTKVGMSTFYSYNKTFISISADYFMTVLSKITSFIENLVNPLKIEEPQKPTPIEEPDDFLPDQIVHIPFTSFQFADSVSAAQQTQRIKAAEQKTISALSALPPLDPNLTYTTAELTKYISRNVLSSAVEKGHLIRVKRGIYRVPQP